MTNDQLYPLEASALTGEPFLRLKHHRNIILTPPRPSDKTCYPPILNDPSVYEQLIGPPIPFLPEHAKAFFAKAKGSSDDVLTKLSASKDIKIPAIVEHCPINAIREVSEGGVDIFLGDVSLRRCTDVRLLTAIADSDSLPASQRGARQAEENSSRIIGDPRIIWTIGCFLIPSHHGQGIMTDVIETLLQLWAVPRMGVHRILVGAFGSNPGSVKLFQKNNFVLKRSLKNYVEARGVSRDLHILEWNNGEYLTRDTCLPSSS